MKTIKLARHERIVAVVPEYCSGPGWSNQVVWVYIDGDRGFFGVRRECLQLEDLSPVMLPLLKVGAAMAEALRDAVPVERES